MRRFRRFSVAAWVRWTLLLSAAAYLLLRMADFMLLGPLAAVAETEARMRGAEAINRVLVAAVAKDLDQADIVTYQKDKDGRISAYQINTRGVNQVAAGAAAAVQDEFRRLSETSFGVPLGALSGSRLLGAAGPRIPVHMLPIGSVTVNIRQEFKGEGINQTRHRIWLNATARIRVAMPVLSKEVEVSADVPITETIIVGPVPSGFYGGGNVGGVTMPAGP
jgi:sporulation protein YunB